MVECEGGVFPPAEEVLWWVSNMNHALGGSLSSLIDNEDDMNDATLKSNKKKISSTSSSASSSPSLSSVASNVLQQHWKALPRHDSLMLELAHRQWVGQGSDRSDKLKVSVYGDLLEVQLVDRICSPVYWDGPHQTVCRGTWYYRSGKEWMPLQEDIAHSLESLFQRRLWNSSVDLPIRIPLHALPYTVTIYCENNIVLHTNDAVTRAISSLAKSVWTDGDRFAGRSVRRGFDAAPSSSEQERDVGGSMGVGHLVFLIHGIGQRLNRQGGNITAHADTVRSQCHRLAGEHFSKERARDGRVEFIPVQWRTSLDLDHTKESPVASVDDVTLPEVQKLRCILNDSALDILLYKTPRTQQLIVQHVIQSMNNMYALFTSRNPDFLSRGGKVSVLAHSLGSCIIYDILCHQKGPPAPIGTTSSILEECNDKFTVDEDDDEETKWLKAQINELELRLRRKKNADGFDRERDITDCANVGAILKPDDFREFEGTSKESESALPLIKFDRLAFEVNTLFICGSPLGLFLSIRGQRILPTSLPRVDRLVNVFHPYDPLAYRLEPMVLRSYSMVDPPHVPYYKGGNRLYISVANVTEDMVTKGKTVINQLTTFGSFLRRPATKSPVISTKTKKVNINDQDELIAQQIMEDIGGPLHHIDYRLQEGPVENQWLSAMTAHTDYWSNLDFSRFIISQLYNSNN